MHMRMHNMRMHNMRMHMCPMCRCAQCYVLVCLTTSHVTKVGRAVEPHVFIWPGGGNFNGEGD